MREIVVGALLGLVHGITATPLTKQLERSEPAVARGESGRHEAAQAT